MRTRHEVIFAERTRWQQCQRDIKGLLAMPGLTLVNESLLKRLQRAVEDQIATCHTALQDPHLK